MFYELFTSNNYYNTVQQSSRSHTIKNKIKYNVYKVFVIFMFKCTPSIYICSIHFLNILKKVLNIFKLMYLYLNLNTKI